MISTFTINSKGRVSRADFIKIGGLPGNGAIRYFFKYSGTSFIVVSGYSPPLAVLYISRVVPMLLKLDSQSARVLNSLALNHPGKTTPQHMANIHIATKKRKKLNSLLSFKKNLTTKPTIIPTIVANETNRRLEVHRMVQVKKAIASALRLICLGQIIHQHLLLVIR